MFITGACVNNTSVMMFKKGSFEVDCPVYPVAIKYNPAFGDAFWGHQPTMQAHIWEMMTSWAIVCKVWYLPPMNREVSVQLVRKTLKILPCVPAQLVDLTELLLWVQWRAE